MMYIYIVGMLKKYGWWVVALAVAFVAGYFTMRSYVTSELTRQHRIELNETKLFYESSYEKQLFLAREQITQEVTASLTKSQETEKTTVIKPDGTTIVRERSKMKEESTITEKVDKESTTREEAVVTKEATISEKTVAVEETVEAKKSAILPPQRRVYAVALIDDVRDRKDAKYGIGVMYDIGPANVGGIGLYESSKSQVSVGITLGVSF